MLGRDEMCMGTDLYVLYNKQTITNVPCQSLDIALRISLACGSLLFSKAGTDVL